MPPLLFAGSPLHTALTIVCQIISVLSATLLEWLHEAQSMSLLWVGAPS
jgi:hypothetical protein